MPISRRPLSIPKAKDQKGNAPFMRCPHCEAPAIARTSQEITRLYREISYQCRNVQCGFTWIAGLGAVRTLSPSGCPAQGVEIPLSTSLRNRAGTPPPNAPADLIIMQDDTRPLHYIFPQLPHL